MAAVLLQLTDILGLFKMPKIQLDVVKALIPMVAINVLGLGISMLRLVYVDTSFYQVQEQKQASSFDRNVIL